MKCPFPSCEDMPDNPEFDDPIAHLIITVGTLGHTHVHGPFDQEFIIKRMVDSLMAELFKQGIRYTLPKFGAEKEGDPLND